MPNRSWPIGNHRNNKEFGKWEIMRQPPFEKVKNLNTAQKIEATVLFSLAWILLIAGILFAIHAFIPKTEGPFPDLKEFAIGVAISFAGILLRIWTSRRLTEGSERPGRQPAKENYQIRTNDCS